MIDITDFEFTKIELKELEMRLSMEIHFFHNFPKNNDERKLETEWANAIINSYTYSVMLINVFLNSIEDFKEFQKEDFHYFVGKIAIQHLLELINNYEQVINKAVNTFDEFDQILNNRIEKKIDRFRSRWKENESKKDRQLESEVLDCFKMKKREQAFIRDTLYSKKIIDDDDFKILVFAWDIRNSMHLNFSSVKDINFEYFDFKTGKKYKFNYPKGTELYHPGDLLGFFSISTQIQFILLKILQYFRKNNL